MGADYCWMYVEVPPECVTIDHDLPGADIDIDAYGRYLTGLIEEADPGLLRTLAIEMFRFGDDDESDDSIERAWQASFDIVLDCARGKRRDAAYSVINNMVILHSGGMSWGEGPTDAFDALHAVDTLEWELAR